MAVRTKRLAAATVGAVATVIYTCPAGETAIVKNVSVQNSQALLQATTVLSVRVAGVDYGILDVVLAAQRTQLFTPWAVLQPGTQLVAVSNQAGQRIYVSGSELGGIAD